MITTLRVKQSESFNGIINIMISTIVFGTIFLRSFKSLKNTIFMSKKFFGIFKEYADIQHFQKLNKNI